MLSEIAPPNSNRIPDGTEGYVSCDILSDRNNPKGGSAG